MSDEEIGRIAIDDVVAAATTGVLRALEARNIVASDFTRDNGFLVDVHVRAGSWPDPRGPRGSFDPAVGGAGDGLG